MYAAASVLFAILFFLITYDYKPLNPFNFSWLMDKDPAIHFLGWALYQQSPWEFPLAKVSSLMEPIGSSIINTDSIPLMCVPLKLLFGGGTLFQFSGAWILLCYTLQAYFGYRIMRLLSGDRLYACLAATFFTISPPLLFRYEHKSLCAHWVILWGLYLYFSAMETKRVSAAKNLTLNLVTISIHPYLLPMTFAISISSYVSVWLKLRDRATLYKALSFGVVTIGCVSLIMYCIGYFMLSNPGSWGFNTFSADLLTFFNSQYTGSFLKRIRYSSSQREGYAYLGAGMIALLFGWLYLRKKRTQVREEPILNGSWPLWIVAIGGFIFSLSGHVTFAGNPILYLDWFYDLFGPLTQIFRSPGRFLWIFYYLVTACLCLIPLRYFEKQRALFLLGLALLLQFIDLGKWYADHSDRAPAETKSTLRLPAPIWETLQSRGIKHLKLLPPAIAGEKDGCEVGTFSPDEIRALWLVAAKQQLSFNSALVSRAPMEAIRKECKDAWLRLRLNESGEGSDFAFVLPDDSTYLSRFKEAAGPAMTGVQCTLVDNLYLCLPPTT